MTTADKLTERLRFASRDVRRFLASPDFFESVRYEQDVADYVTCHPSWVSSEDDLTDLGREARAYLIAHPEMVEAA